VIASVEGIVGAITADSLVIEVNGIGYRVFAAPAIIAAAVAGAR
jgi:Holliday junction resolvasome RuvABC DNA-binding subunit